jgi:hypothetical protein
MQNLSKSVANVLIMGIIFTPWGCLGPRKGLEGCGAVTAQRAGAEAVAKLCSSSSSGVCYACFHAWIHGLYPVWSFASGSNCRNAAITQLRKARFFAEQKMRPNEVLKKPLVSVITLQVEAL